MRTGKSISISPTDQRRLKALTKDRNAPQKHVWRAEIVLFTAGEPEKPRPASGAGRNALRVRGPASRQDAALAHQVALGAEVAEHIVALTLGDPPGETTHWTGALMAKASGLSVSSVQRIWRAHGLQPHRVRQFKLSNDPRFVDKLREVVGLYVDPPAHAIVLSVDEKSQIQA